MSQPNNPLADPKAIVTAGQARFTVLTPQLIRMEWSAEARFEDHASLVFINRRLPVPEFKTITKGDWLQLKTANLNLRYKKNSGKFTKDNLEIQFTLNGKPVLWRPGIEDKGNLYGTIRTLDGVRGAVPLESGLLSRDGWVLVDDTERPLFDDSDWPWVMPRPAGERQDWYFFAYGHDYKKALYDFTRVAGKIPMPPRFAFGTWWSRYWAYTDQEFKQLVHEFEIHDVPLDVLVIDMDWHLTFNLRWHDRRVDQAGQRLGWTGYTWDKNYFPDPAGFLKWTESKGLKTPLNLHPASGIQPHEERYPEMARAMGIDPATQKYVPFDIADKKFAENYLKIMHYPLEEQGVDFWWLDWQQQQITKVPGLNPTWWLNYVHFTDMERRGKARPLIFHRWGGLGNHRYQIGFSGDAATIWEMLAFEPYFTATAANVGYGYWSHDIGGHMPGEVSPELYTRWIQFGVFSPILRTHTTKNPKAERRIWAYPVDYFLTMREAFLLRYALIPYIYTAARQAYDTGISICRPMYYDYPEIDAAYEFKDQYLFGDNLLVAPIAEPVSTNNLLASKRIWLPKGEWIEWFTGTRLRGPAVAERMFAVDEIPLYVKAGSIIPMQPKMRNTGEKPVDPLILTVFPGDSGSVRIYEDAGNSRGYQKDEYTWTSVRHTKTADGKWKIEIFPAQGHYPGMLTERAYEIRLPGVWPPEAVSYNNQPVAHSQEDALSGWRYDGDKLMTIVSLPKFQVSEKVEVLTTLPAALVAQDHLLDGVPGKLARLRRVMPLLNSLWPQEWSPEILVAAAQTGNRISINSQNTLAELQKLEREFPEVLNQVSKLQGDSTTIAIALAHLRSK
ncbi:MAG: glycoside hydrolase family 31 protein [candidate division KSB1 bacterium]|nr:glycoside hydrolase family 31 protein [candidate division KSB1 bacterium]MDZ7304652.1 glycoside hydrolase family 31 protein [candidate division KSB1 bacterium]MDZ7313784.1 glycoside hydrolase family 31 protein [candidate division KSB1 bacterium]